MFYPLNVYSYPYTENILVLGQSLHKINKACQGSLKKQLVFYFVTGKNDSSLEVKL